MEYFTKSKIIKLKSHLDKYIIADDNNGKVRQSRNGAIKRAQWTVEIVQKLQTHHHVIRLKSHNGKYLTATETPYPLTLTGKRVILTELENGVDGKNEWQPIRDGFQVKLRSCCGRFLKGNGGNPPWRNSVTIDDSFVKMEGVLWDVEGVMEDEFESLLSSFGSDDVSFSSDIASPMSVFSLGSSPPARGSFQSQVCFLLCLLFCFYFYFFYFLFGLNSPVTFTHYVREVQGSNPTPAQIISDSY